MNPSASGETAGLFFVVVLCLVVTLVGIALNVVSMARRRTSKLCALGMILALAGWAIAIPASAALRFTKVSPLVQMVPGFLLFACCAASTVVSILGLVDVSTPRRYRRGRKRAIAALVLNALFFISLVCGIALSLARKDKSSTLMTSAGAPGETIRNEQWNFRLETPAQWAPVKSAALNPLARAALARQGAPMFFIVIGEDLTQLGGVRLEPAMESIKNNLRANGSAEFLEEGDWSEHGLPGRRLESLVTNGPQHYFYVHWVVQNQGTLYQLITWGAAPQRDEVRAESRKLIASFHLLDPKRSGLAESERAPATFLSRPFGYAVNLTDTVWTRRWANLAKDSPFAEFGVMNPAGTACFCIVPVWLGDDELDLDLVTRALAARVNIPFPDEGVFGIKDLRVGSLRGRAFAFERTQDGVEFHYRLRVLRGQGFAWLLAAWMAKEGNPFPDFLDEGMDRVSFAEQVEPEPLILSERERTTHAFVWNEIGLDLDRAGRTEAALPWLRRAFETSRSNATILANYAETALKIGKAAEALEYFDRHLDRFPGNHKLAAKRAILQSASGDTEGALKSYGALFDAGWRDDTEFAGYLHELIGRSQADAALAALDRYAQGRETPPLRRLRARVLQARGEHDQAIALLTELRQDAPNDQETALALADAYFVAQRHPEAIAECERLIAAKRDSASVYRRKGFAEYALKRYREAKASLEKAHQKDPASADLKRMLDHVSGMLGEGGNSTVKAALEPVPIPAALLADGPADKTDAYLRGYSAWYRHAVKAIAFEKNDELKTTEQQAIQILDQQGVEKFSTLDFRFDPLSEEIFVNALTVRNEAGEIVAKGRVEDSYVVDDGVGEAATQRKILHVPVPALQPGYTLEYMVTHRETGIAKAFTFQPHAFSKSLPVLRSVLHIQAPREAVKWETTTGVPAPKRSDGALTWTVERPAVYRWEPVQAPLETFLPMIWLADAGATWPGEAKEYLAQVKERLPVEASVREAAATATRGLSSPGEKIAALSRFVQRELTYKAIEFGRRARIPNPASQTLRNKYGDCKDHALLLCQLLEAAGIPAQLALVNSASELRPSLPSLDQFNHMIAYLPAEKGGAFIDCTSKCSDLRAAPPNGLATRQALILDAARPRLEKIPAHSAGSSAITAHREVSFPTETDVQVQEDLTFTGAVAAGLRGMLQAIEPANRSRQLLQMMNHEAPSLDLREALIEGIDDPQRPLGLRLRYTLRRKFQNVAGQLIGQLPAVWERLYLAGEPVEQRLTPFKLWVPLKFESHVSLTPPAGWQAAPAEAPKVAGPFCTGIARARLEQRTLRVESTLTQDIGQFPPAQYGAFVEAGREALGLVEQGVALQRAGK
ncbi:MAG: hypothetical protein QOE70_4995 [Chthoniobacter sp.]|jgi:tetratricopeptide (TPR) repeat protein|nr:hypothetical protein [Chthoniobacter sp.]